MPCRSRKWLGSPDKLANRTGAAQRLEARASVSMSFEECDAAIPPHVLVTDCHVSTARRGSFGLGFDVQREVVRRFLFDGASQLVDESPT